jgi:hypothetical protein
MRAVRSLRRVGRCASAALLALSLVVWSVAPGGPAAAQEAACADETRLTLASGQGGEISYATGRAAPGQGGAEGRLRRQARPVLAQPRRGGADRDPAHRGGLCRHRENGLSGAQRADEWSAARRRLLAPTGTQPDRGRGGRSQASLRHPGVGDEAKPRKGFISPDLATGRD